MDADAKTLVSSGGQHSLALRSYRDIAAELQRRHGWTIGHTRVEQICKLAERKLRKRLADLYHDTYGAA